VIRRWLLYIVSTVSLLLLAATIGLWIDGYYAHRHANLQFGDYVANVTTMYGAFFLVSTRAATDRDVALSHDLPGLHYLTMNQGPVEHDPTAIGRQGWVHTTVVVVHPGYFVFSLSLLPLCAVLAFCRKRRSRIRAGTDMCVNCSYNLTANTSGVCPECGTAVHLLQL
jgi:hypothetical protein